MKTNEILNNLEIPQSPVSERSLLGALLLDPTLYFKCEVERKGRDLFYLRGHRFIYEAIGAMCQNDVPIDIVTLAEWLKSEVHLDEVGGMAYIASLLDSAVRTTSVVEYCRVLKEMSMRRDLMRRAERLMCEAEDPEESVATTLLRTEDYLKKARQELIPSGEFDLKAHLSSITKESLSSCQFKGLSTGYRDLDRVLTGLRDGEQTVLAARPGAGKTSLAGNICEHQIFQKKHVAFFSLEMTRESLVARWLCQMAKVNLQDYLARSLRKDEIERIEFAKERLASVAEYLHIYDSAGATPADVAARCEILKEQNELDLCVVDYIQIMRCHIRTDNRVRELGAISNYLRDSAKELDIHTLNLSQLSRAPEAAVDHRPRLNHLRESGDIEQNADNVLFIYREEMYEPTAENQGTAEIIVAKQRNGPAPETVQMTFLKEFTRFESYYDGKEF